MRFLLRLERELAWASWQMGACCAVPTGSPERQAGWRWTGRFGENISNVVALNLMPRGRGWRDLPGTCFTVIPKMLKRHYLVLPRISARAKSSLLTSGATQSREQC